MSEPGSAAGVEMPPPRISERPIRTAPGLTILVVTAVILLAGIAPVVDAGVARVNATPSYSPPRRPANAVHPEPRPVVNAGSRQR